MDHFDIDWSNLLNLNEKNIDLATNNFLNAMDSLLNKYATFKTISKYKLKYKTKLWVTYSIQISICIKNKLLKKFINRKDPQVTTECQEKYKKYKNLLSTLLKESKQIYTLKVTGIALEILGKKSKIQFQLKYYNYNSSLN